MMESKIVATDTSNADAVGASCVRLSELVLKVARKFRRNFTVQLAPLGVTFAQAQVLRIVERADEPLRMVDLAAKLDIVPRSATTKVDALQAMGLVQRLSDDTDRRSIPIAITEKGRALLAQLDEVRRITAKELFSELPEVDRQELSRFLNIVCSHTYSLARKPPGSDGEVSSLPSMDKSRERVNK